MAESPLDEPQPGPLHEKKRMPLLDVLGRIALGLIALQAVAGISYGIHRFATRSVPTSEPAPTADRCEANNPDYQAEAGLALSGDWPGAHEALTARIEQSPEDGCLYAWRGRAAAYMGDINAALLDLDRAVALAPEAAAPYRFRGELFALWGSVEVGADQAVADLHRSLELMPNDAYAWHLLGRAYHLDRQCDPAVDAFGAAARLDPAFAEPLIERARMLVEPVCEGRENAVIEALNDITEAIDNRPEDINLHVERLQMLDQYMPAQRNVYLDRATELHPEYHPGLIDIQLRGIDNRASLEVLTAAIDSADDCTQACMAGLLRRRAWIYVYELSHENALADFARSLELDPGDIPTWNQYIWILSRTDLNIAIEEQERAISVNGPADPEWSTRLGSLYAAAGNCEEALPLFEEPYSTRYPDLLNLTACFLSTERLDEAREMLAFAANGEDWVRNFYTMDGLYEVLQSSLGPDATYDLFSQVSADQPQNALLHIYLAAAALEIEDWETSLRHAEAAIDLGEGTTVEAVGWIMRYLARYRIEGPAAALTDLGPYGDSGLRYAPPVDEDLRFLAGYYQLAQGEAEVEWEIVRQDVEHLERLFESSPDPMYLYVEGLLFERAGLPIRAREEYRAFLARYEIEDAVRADAQTRLDAIEAQAAP